MTKTGTGTYEYLWDIPSDSSLGLYKAKAIAPKDGHPTKEIKDFVVVEG
jgi:hypothetical protein